MDNGACSYRRFLDGDDNGFIEIVRDYKDGLMLFLNRYTNNLSVSEELMEETFYRLAIKKTAFYGQIQLQNLALYHWQKLGSELHQTKCPAGCNPPTGTNRYGNRRRCMERSYIQSEDRLILYKALSRIHPNYRIVLHLIFFEDMTNTQAAKVMKKNPRQITNLVYRAKHALKSEPEKEGFHYEEL